MPKPRSQHASSACHSDSSYREEEQEEEEKREVEERCRSSANEDAAELSQQLPSDAELVQDDGQHGRLSCRIEHLMMWNLILLVAYSH